MAENLIDLRRRIGSVKNTQKITRAMKTVSAAKLRRSVTDLNRTSPSMDTVADLLARIRTSVDLTAFPLMQTRDKGDIVIVLLTSDKGLCGSFNAQVISAFNEAYKKYTDAGEKVRVAVIGKKGCAFIRKNSFDPILSDDKLMSSISFEKCFELSKFFQDLYLKEDIKKIEFIYTEYISSSKQEVSTRQMLPLVKDWDDNDGEFRYEKEYIFEPDAETIFRTLLPRYIDSLVFRLILESAASEHSARMIAMDLATRNASEMIRALTLTMNKLRQAAITTEILEIITATEALQK